MSRTLTLSAVLAGVVGLVGLAPAAGCDRKATASDPTAVSPARLSKELESCSATSQCADGLRCLDQLCQREARSMVGDFLAARGARALAANDVQASIAAYAEASAAYEGEKLTVPPDLDCAWGTALVAARAQKDKAELAARILHRCLLAMPPGGRLRAAALASLTELDGSGFDPRQLARPQLADLYLTKAPSKPDPASTNVTIAADPAPKGKTWPVIADRLGKPDVKEALQSCWSAAWDAREQRALVSKLAFKVTYLASDYDDEAGKYTFAAEPAGAASAGSADSDACVKAAILAPLAELKGLRENVSTTLTVTIK
ncbi:MAG TPA: hypothetical protein VHE35_33225 [Kofleriaceae bacterium]|nr:hypothetical protein [Kofleriaceae bacterium]